MRAAALPQWHEGSPDTLHGVSRSLHSGNRIDDRAQRLYGGVWRRVVARAGDRTIDRDAQRKRIALPCRAVGQQLRDDRGNLFLMASCHRFDFGQRAAQLGDAVQERATTKRRAVKPFGEYATTG